MKRRHARLGKHFERSRVAVADALERKRVAFYRKRERQRCVRTDRAVLVYDLDRHIRKVARAVGFRKRDRLAVGGQPERRRCAGRLYGFRLRRAVRIERDGLQLARRVHDLAPAEAEAVQARCRILADASLRHAVHEKFGLWRVRIDIDGRDLPLAPRPSPVRQNV